VGAQEITIVFIVNGEDVPIATNVRPPLREAVARALTQSGNTGRPVDDWEVRDANGALLDTSRRIEDFAFSSGVRLFVSLRVGAGGQR
jgi:hypothetical protein